VIRYDCAQRSEEWDRLRLGIPTASAFSRIVKGGTAYTCQSCAAEFDNRRKKCAACGEPVIAHEILKPSSQAEAYMHKLLAEWYFGAPLEDPETQYQSAWMERGAALEDQAVKSYEFETGLETEKVGFISTDDGMVGCSPDRLVGADGILEIKCPSPPIHMGYMVKRSVDSDYWAQIQGQMLIAGRAWVDIESYCPPFPTVIIRVPRDDQYASLLVVQLAEFVHAMQQARTLVVKTYGPPLRSKIEKESE
jgi:hypothetical protein